MALSDDPEKRAAQLNNLKKFEPGDKRINRAGRPKGVKSWGTIVQTMLADEALLDKLVKNKPSYWNDLEQKNAANLIVATMLVKAMSGDQKAADWLRKTGFGDKLVHELEDGFFEKQKLTIEIVQPKHDTSDIDEPS